VSLLSLLSLLWLSACGGPVARVDLGAQGQAPKAGVEPTTLVVTLQGKLGTQELARCHRTLRAGSDLAYVVFRLDTAGSQGEDEGDVQSLLDHMQTGKVKTIAVLSGHVTHGAAAMALCADKVFCLPGVQWGEVTKPDQEWSELLSGNPDEAMAARLDAARDAMAARLARRATPLRPDAQKLALAMVDPRIQLVAATVREGGIERPRVLDQAELAALNASNARPIGEQAFPRPLFVTAQEAEDFGLSSGTLSGFDQLADVLSIDRATIGELQVNWAEHMVGWLELLQPFLLVAGFLLLLVEIKTPGVGLPGLLGVVFLGLALFHSYLVGLAEVTEILVFFLGLCAIGVEIFLLPGTIVFGAVGFLCLVLSLVLSQQSFVLPSNTVEEGILLGNLWNLTLLFVAVLVLGALLWRVLPKVPWFNRVFLLPPQPQPSTAGGGSASGLGIVDATSMALVGRVGKAVTVLRPTGAMEIDGQRIDVVTEGEFVEAGAPVRVLYVQGPRVVVGLEPGPGQPSGGQASRGQPGRAGERGSVGLVLLLCVLGLALIVAEVTFVSFGIIATLSGVALLSAVFVAFQDSTAFGVTMVVVEAVAAPIVLALSFKLLPKTRFGKMLILDGPASAMNAAGADGSLGALLHKEGVTLSPLRPAGFARIDGRRVDVVTRGEMLDADCPIVVLEVAGNRVVVGRR
jgi:membrane-bound serine protease (ClpP class)